MQVKTYPEVSLSQDLSQDLFNNENKKIIRPQESSEIERNRNLPEIKKSLEVKVQPRPEKLSFQKELSNPTRGLAKAGLPYQIL